MTVSSGQKATDPIDLAFEHAPWGALIIDADTLRVVRSNSVVRRALGYASDRLLSMTLAELAPDLAAAGSQDSLARFPAEEVRDVSVQLRRADGSRTDAVFRIRPVEDPPRHFVLQIMLRDPEAGASGDVPRAQLQAAIEALPEGVAIFDQEDRLTVCNAQFQRAFALSAPAIAPGVSFEAILRYGVAHGQYPSAVGGERDWIADRLEAHRSAKGIRFEDLGNDRWFRVAERHVAGGGTVMLCIDIAWEVTGRLRAEEAEQRMRAAIDAIPAGFQLFDADDRMVMANRNYREMYGIIAEILEPGVTYEEIIRYGVRQGQFPEAVGKEEKFVRRALAARRGGYYELTYKLDNGRWMRSSNIHLDDGSKVGFRVDVTELKEKQCELRRITETDPLTGLLNRRGVQRHLAETAPRLRDGNRLAALHIDLDKFKAVNDGIGHDAGDFVLRDVARRLRKNLREGDVLARVGGDEFLALLVTPDDRSGLLSIADALRDEICRPVRFKGWICQIGATIGISTWKPGDEVTVDKAISNADMALNIGKQEGRNRAIFYDSEMRAAQVEQALLAQDLRQALTDERILPYFQPQFSTDGARVTGFECLARWDHPDRGVLTASKFFPAAEGAGLVAEIDRRILDQSVATFAKLRRQGFAGGTLSLNLSGARLSDATIVDELEWTLEARNLAPADIRIEIVEATLIGERSLQIVENVRALSERGFGVELDNFGTGQTAIASLREFPVDRIKIARSLVKGIDLDPSSYIIAETIIGLARKLGIEVLAEGIETEGEMAVLRVLGCVALQGHHLVHPMPAEALFDWLRERGDLGEAGEVSG